jgi:hypothetical protein
MRRLLTLPGVSAVTAFTLVAAVGEIGRFPTPQHLVSYLGLDPRVSQSGNDPARHGRISKQGSGEARHPHDRAAARLCPARQEQTRHQRRHRGGRSEARRAGLAAAHPPAGLRLRAAILSPREAPPPGAVVRRHRASWQPGWWTAGVCYHQPPPAGKAARRPGRTRLPAAGAGLERGRQAGCGRDTGARIFSRQCGSSAAGPEPQRPALEHVVTRTPPRLWHHQLAPVQPKLTFIRRSPPTRATCR